MTLNEVRKAYASKQISLDEAINQICSYLVELDRNKMIDIVDWIIIEDKKDIHGSSYDYFFKVVDDDMCITIDTLEDIVMLTLKIDLQKVHKNIWRMIYNDKLEVEHGKVIFEHCNQYGASYGSGRYPYCIFKNK